MMGTTHDNVVGLVLAVSSSVFIGSSFIVKKMGLIKAASNGKRAGSIKLFFKSILIFLFFANASAINQPPEAILISTNPFGGSE